MLPFVVEHLLFFNMISSPISICIEGMPCDGLVVVQSVLVFLNNEQIINEALSCIRLESYVFPTYGRQHNPISKLLPFVMTSIISMSGSMPSVSSSLKDYKNLWINGIYDCPSLFSSFFSYLFYYSYTLTRVNKDRLKIL